MLKLKTAAPSVEQLETALADRQRELAERKADFRDARLKWDDAKALAAEDETSRQREQAVEAAYADVRKTSDAVEKATLAVQASERELEVARTKPQRQESAQRLNADADVLEKAIAGLRKPLAELIEAVDGASHPEVAHEPGPMIFATQVSNLWQALTGPDGANFASAIRQLGERIKNGEADYRLRQTIAEEAASLRKVG